MIKTDENGKELKKFIVGDILNFYKGKRVTKDNQLPGSIPYITAVSSNNGIDNFIDNPIEIKENMITMNFFGDCFYHPYRFGIKDGTYAVEIKDEKYRKKENYLYVSSILEKVGKTVGSYSKMLTDSLAKKLFIELPVDFNGDPDWEYMGKYISNIERDYVDSVKSFNDRELRILDTIYADTESPGEPYEYKEFRVGDVFNITMGKPVKEIKNTGKIPVVTGNTENYGVVGYIDEIENTKMFFNNAITVTTRGEKSGTAFYQSRDFYAGNNVLVLTSKNENLSKNSLLYITTLINKMPYGGYSNYPSLGRFINDKLNLPSNPDGFPDWDYMEKYISSIAGGEKKNRQVDYFKKQGILEYLITR